MDCKYYEGKIGYLKNVEKLKSLIQEIKLDEELSTGEKLDLEKRINKEISDKYKSNIGFKLGCQYIF